MEEIQREEFKNVDAYNFIYEHLKKGHVVPKYTIRGLIEHKGIKDFIESSRCYVMMKLGGQDWFMHYDIDSFLISKDVIGTRITSIGLYKNFMEYEGARLKGLYSTTDSQIPNQN